MLDLGDQVPKLPVKLGSKTYEISASDENIQVIDKIMELYVDMNNQINEMQDELDQGTVKSGDYRRFSNNLMTSIREQVIKIFDELLTEPGIGQKLWELKGHSTEYLLESLKQIQSSLTAIKQRYSYQKNEEIKQIYKTYPSAKAKPIRHKKYKK